ADGSVGFPHVRVGHCQAYTPKKPVTNVTGFFLQDDFYINDCFHLFVSIEKNPRTNVGVVYWSSKAV
ncbi:MAG: hypothetical protein OEY36_12475, partial [Gammaproteobacteria bacterium]|nr:hypothetical protein [Gammaproteobacteria bacterium]